MYVREQPTRLHLVRHGEVDEAYHQVFGGSIDMELSATGHEQAKSLAKFLQGRNFDHIYRSPMVRVRQTAKPLLDALGREAEVIDELREVDFGVWTGHKWHEIQGKFGVDAEDWLVHLENGDVAEAEPMDGYRSRIRGSLEQMMGEGAGTGRACAVPRRRDPDAVSPAARRAVFENGPLRGRLRQPERHRAPLEPRRNQAAQLRPLAVAGREWSGVAKYLVQAFRELRRERSHLTSVAPGRFNFAGC